MRKIEFQPIITLGNMISIMSVLVTLLGFALYNERRMTQSEEGFKMHDYRISRTESALEEIREELRYKLSLRTPP